MVAGQNWHVTFRGAVVLVTTAVVLGSGLVAIPSASALGAPPSAVGDAYTVVDRDAFDVLGNDSDPEANALTVVSNTQPTNGSATCNSTGDCIYSAHAGFVGADSFQYTIHDTGGNSATAQVAITVTGAPDSSAPPTPVPDEIVTKSGSPVTANVLTNDHSGAGATMVVATGPSHGTVACTTAGSCTYTPASGFVGYDGFGYDVTDSFGTTRGTALITVVAVTAGYDETANGNPVGQPSGTTSLTQGDSAAWAVASAPKPAGLPQQYATASRPATTTVSLVGPHALDPASVTTAKGWTSSQVGSTTTFTSTSTALLGESTTNPLPPPLPPISQGSGGDGHVPIIVGTRVYAFFHHTHPTEVTCIDRTTGQLCPGYPHQLDVGSTDIIGPGAVVGSRIYIHPVLDESYAQRAPVSLYCWDTNTDSTCGLIILDRLDTTSDPGASAPRLVSGKLYVAADGGKLYCVDPSTNSSCATAAVSIPLAADQFGSSYDIVTHGSRVFVSQSTPFAGGPAPVACVDVTTNAACTGWNAAKTFQNWNIVNHHSVTGVADGVCGVGVAPAESECVLDTSPATVTAMDGWPLNEQYYAVTQEAEAGTRTLFGLGFDAGMGCWDWSTNGLCTGGHWTAGITNVDSAGEPLSIAYGASFDGTCAVGLGDPGQVFTVDLNGASPCTSLSAGSVRRIVDLRDQRCDGTTGAATWQNVQVVEADLAAGHDFDSLFVTVRDATTDAVLASREMVGTNGVLDLTGINVGAHPALALDATAAKATGSDPWADGNPPRLILNWHADPAAGCFHTTTVINCAQTTATPIGISASPVGTAAASASLSLQPSPLCKTLTVARNGNGSGTVSSSPAGISCGATCSARYQSGTPVTLTAAAVSGSVFSGWSGGGCSGTSTCVVTLTGDTTVTATFTVLRSLTVTKVGSGSGTVTSVPAGISCGATCSASYVDGTPVTLTATATAGSVFSGWSGGGCSGTGTCQVTVNADTSVSATFTLLRTLTVVRSGSGGGTVTSSPSGISCGATCAATFPATTAVSLTATAAAGSTFTGWSGGGCSGTGTCTVTLSADTSVTATFTLVTPKLTVTKSGAGAGSVTSDPSGISCGATCSSNYATGAVVTLTAAAATGSTFTGWSGGGCTGVGTCVVTLTADTTVTAAFALIDETLTVAKSGDGAGSVSSTPGGISCGATCSTTFSYGTAVTLTAAPAAGSTFAGWSGGGCSGTGTCQVTMTSAVTVTATFSAVNPTLTVGKNGTGSGSVTSNPSGITCGATCAKSFPSNTSVTLTAVPAAGSTFAGWSGGGCSGTSTCVVTLTADTTVTATFTAITPSLTVTRAGSGTGTVTSNPGGINCGATCSTTYPQGTVVTLTADAAVGSRFAGWSGGGCSGIGTCQVTVTSDTTVTATFIARRTLTVSKTGTGAGTITSSPAGIDCGATCSAVFDDAAIVTLTAVPTSASAFTGWSGGGCSGTGTCQVTLGSNAAVAANFNALRTLTVTPGGSGTGSVTSNPAGISCPTVCASKYQQGTAITLTAAPDAGSVFSGWSGGGCSGMSTCQVTMSSDTTVTATFTVLRTLTIARTGNGAGSVTSNPAGISCGATCSATFGSGSSITLTAAAAAGSVFSGWSGGGCSGSGTCVVALTADSTVTASFSSSRTLVVTKTGGGSGTVTSTPAGISCGATCTASYATGTSVTLAASAASGSTFAGWSGGGCSGTGTCVVVVTADSTADIAVTASFTSNAVVLTVTKSGTGTGTVTSSPAGIGCGATCTKSYAPGTGVTLTAAAAVGSRFAGWGGGKCTGTGTCVLTLSASTTVTASFMKLVNHRPVAHDDGTYYVRPGDVLCVGRSGVACDVRVVHGVLYNDSDPDGDQLSKAVVTRISFAAKEYTWFANGSFVYRAGVGTSSVETKKIFYVAVDSHGAESNEARIKIVIGPVARDDGTYHVRAGGTLVVGGPNAKAPTGVLNNDDSIAGMGFVRAVVTRIDFAAGEYTWHRNGSFTYRAGPGTRRTLTKHIWYEAVDSDGHHSNVAVVTIVVRPA